MSNTTPAPVPAPSLDLTAPTPPRKKNFAALKAVGVLGVFVVGCVLGASGASGTTKTETVTNIVAPASCKTALDSADTIMHASADAFSAVSKAFSAVSTFDAAGITSQLAPEQAANDKVQATMPLYNQAASDCRSK